MIDVAGINVGDEIVSAEFGPLTIVDTVRWAGVQENPERLHWDREFAREHSRLRTFIASGGYRQALLARALTDWLGANGRLARMKVRHVAPTFEGDILCYSVRVTEKSAQGPAVTLTCAVDGSNQQNDKVLTGSCILTISPRAEAPTG
jgi:acyl dehydratase